MEINTKRYQVICIFNPLKDYRFSMHGFITHSDTMSYNNLFII